MIELYKVGCVAKLKQTVKVPGGVMRAVVEGVSRARILEPIGGKKYLSAVVQVIEEDESEDDNLLMNEAFIRAAEESLDGYFKYNKRLNRDAVNEA